MDKAIATYISSPGAALLSKKIGTTGKRAVFSVNGYRRSLALATFNQVAVPSSGVVSISKLEDIWGEAKGDPEHLDAHASTRFNEKPI